MSVETLGEIDGRAVRAVRFSGGGLSARVMEWGCVTLDLRMDGVARPLTFAWPRLEDYARRGGGHVGAIAGRCANRIGGGAFAIDGVTHRTARNVDGRTTLHGGDGGFGRSHWRLDDHGPDRARFSIRHADGREGFPGAIEAECVYLLTGGAMRIVLTARSDAPTLCNLAQHNYYNLSGDRDVDGHELTVAADRVTPLDASLVPTGAVAPPPDDRAFRAARKIGAAAIDLNYVLAPARRATPAFAARLSAGGVGMTLETTEPGLQVYTADNLPGAARAGVCLEPQLWPDAANNPAFPSAVLRPGETYRQETRLIFSRAAH